MASTISPSRYLRPPLTRCSTLFTPTRALIMCEPTWRPLNGVTVVGVAVKSTMAGTNMSRSATLGSSPQSLPSTVAGEVVAGEAVACGARTGFPAILSSRGCTYRTKEINAATGFPGKETTGTGRPASLVQHDAPRSEEHTSELQSRGHLVCRLLLEKKKVKYKAYTNKSTNT